jgi:hypothetical protein
VNATLDRVPCRQHENRDRRAPAKPPTDLDPIDAGQAEVEHHQLGRPLGGAVKRARAVSLDARFIAFVAQLERQRARDIRIVLDDQHSRRTSRSHPLSE